MLQVLLPIMNDIRNDITSLKENMIDLSEEFNSVKGKLTSLDETVSHLSGDLEQHKNQTTSVLADLQSLDSKLAAVNTNMTEEITTLENQLSAKLDEQTASITEDVKSFINMSHTELLSLIHNDMECELMTNNKTCVEDKLESEINSEIQQNRTHQVNNSDDNTSPPPMYTCDGTGGWRRAVYLDMTDPNTNCPEGWSETGYSKRTCGRATDGQYTCDSVTFSVSGGEYSQVCGRMRAYQFGATWGFSGYRNGQTTVDDAYITGVGVMHGSPRQHIWSFVAGAIENYRSPVMCPCDTIRHIPIPPFVGEDYFCESGHTYSGRLSDIIQFHSNDVLWDGRDCHSSSICCSLHNPPYFTKTLNTSTTDDIELRLCNYNALTTVFCSNVAVELVEIYIK